MRNTGPSARIRSIVTRRAERHGIAVCERCGIEPVQQIHHRRPRASGGSRMADTNLPSNLLALGNQCHADVESHRADAYSHGWIVRQALVPREMPVLIWDRGYVVLDDIGGMTPALMDIGGAA
ncbi:hypothetical protein LCD36_04870 [Saccharopolyspora sp. 6T]|uniref:HNH endonuclease n=1 Tax=Saccharopolyspora sp. 6T TaxID=2877238 RepID=UPI001CD641A7|nr:HNH endonuclease [Saccharopolyspora sp. 6T]MCA1185785.1 hypothetical protein [Saccharopolyspora sp. 6T]